MNARFLQRNKRVTFTVFLLVPILIASIVFLFLKRMYLDQQQGITLVRHSYDVREQLLELRNDLIQSESGQNIFLLTGSRSYLQPSMFAESDAFVRLAYLSVLLGDQEAQLARLNRLRPLIERMLSENRQAFSSRTADRNVEAPQSQGSARSEEISGLIREMQAEEDRVLSARQKITQSDVDARATVSTILLCVSAAAVVGTGVLLVRVRQLQTIITICAWTQRVNFNGKWMRMEDFLWKRFRVKVSHGISEEAFEGVVGMVGKQITISEDRARTTCEARPQQDAVSGS